MMNLVTYRNKVEQRKGKRDVIVGQIAKRKKSVRRLRRELWSAEKARVILQVTAQQTQDELRYRLSELPQLALQGVFDDPYGFEVKFELRRGKTEADFWFVRDGSLLNPKESAGQGSVDIAGSALRPALWSLRNPRNRAIIVLDEPFKHLKGAEANSRALEMLKSICEPRPEQNWPGLQIIMIADERAPREELLEMSDRLFEFKIKNRKTTVKVVGEMNKGDQL